jgi:uncharacterized membrane protein YhiD involved in acid resistance
VNDFLQMAGSVRPLGAEEMLGAVLLSFVLAQLIAAVYGWTYQGMSYSRSYIHTQVLAAIVTCVLIIAVGNNLARGLGILGTLAIIRFRTPIRDPRDIIFLFASIAVGIASGAGAFMVAVIGAILFCLAAFYLHWSPFATRREWEGLVRFMLPSHSQSEPKIRKILSLYCSVNQQVAARETAERDAVEYSYQIRLIDPSYQTDLLEALQDMPDISDLSLHMHRTTVEI